MTYRTMEAKGFSQVALQDVPEIDAKLNWKWFVQAVMPEIGFTNFFCGTFTENCNAWVAGDHVYQPERHYENAQ